MSQVIGEVRRRPKVGQLPVGSFSAIFSLQSARTWSLQIAYIDSGEATATVEMSNLSGDEGTHNEWPTAQEWVPAPYAVAPATGAPKTFFLEIADPKMRRIRITWDVTVALTIMTADHGKY